jgi:hypothetical protein
MLVTFSSKVDADVLMMGDHAKLVLQAAGKDVSDGIPDRGVFAAEQLDGAIKKLEHAIANKKPEDELQEHEHDDEDNGGREAKTPVVLEQRAYPLLSMMRKALVAKESIMWETGSGW